MRPFTTSPTDIYSYGTTVHMSILSQPIMRGVQIMLRGLVGSHFCTARCRETVWAAGPFTAGGGTARSCRLDGVMVARRRYDPVKVRSRSRKAFEREWYRRRERLVNQRRSASRTGEVDEKSRGLGLPATTHLACTSGKHLNELEPALSPLLTLSC